MPEAGAIHSISGASMAHRAGLFLCQAERAQVPPDRNAVRLNAMPVTQLHHPFIQRQIALFPDPALDPTRHARQLAMPAAVALGPGIKRPGLAIEPMTLDLAA